MYRPGFIHPAPPPRGRKPKKKNDDKPAEKPPVKAKRGRPPKPKVRQWPCGWNLKRLIDKAFGGSGEEDAQDHQRCEQ